MAHCKVQGPSAVSCAKTAEPIEMPFGVWTRMCPRKHVLDSITLTLGATGRIRLNHPCVAEIQPFYLDRLLMVWQEDEKEREREKEKCREEERERVKEWERARDRDRSRTTAAARGKDVDVHDTRTQEERTGVDSDSRLRDVDSERSRDSHRQTRIDRVESGGDRSKRDDDRSRRHGDERSHHSLSREHSPPSDDSQSDDDDSSTRAVSLSVLWSKAPFTRYNPLSNRFDNGLYRVCKHSTCCHTRLTTGCIV